MVTSSYEIVRTIQLWMKQASLGEIANVLSGLREAAAIEQDQRLKALLDAVGEQPLPGESLNDAVTRLAALTPDQLAQRCIDNGAHGPLEPHVDELQSLANGLFH